MAEHMRTQHREYASPGNPHNRGRLPMPADLWHNGMEILLKEYMYYNIAEKYIPLPFDQVSEAPHSPTLPSTPSGGKRSRAFTNTTIDVPAAKQPHHR